jgi:DNA polymerase-3 subunit epsilon
VILKDIFRRGGKVIHPLIQENNAFFDTFDKTLPVQDYDFIVFDTELTGLDKKCDYIIAIGAVRIRNLQICCSETFYLLVKPEKKLHTDSTLIHRITPQELQKAGSIEDVLPRFIKFCAEDVLIGHYVGLDLRFVNRCAKELLGGIIHNPCLDTMRLAMACKELQNGHYCDHYTAQFSYNLASLSKKYNLPEFVQHDALQDSLQTAYLFLFLVENMRRKGLHTLKDFLKAGRNWKIIY